MNARKPTKKALVQRLLRRIEQAEHIGWPALAESFKRELQRVRSSTAETLKRV